jgi:hypothetical protein
VETNETVKKTMKRTKEVNAILSRAVWTKTASRARYIATTDLNGRQWIVKGHFPQTGEEGVRYLVMTRTDHDFLVENAPTIKAGFYRGFTE